jgi:hypothetical protein
VSIEDFIPPGQIRRCLYGWARGVPMTRADALELAEALIKGVCATLDTSKADPCGECGLTKRANWDDSKIFKVLDACENKIRHARRGLWAQEEGQAPA